MCVCAKQIFELEIFKMFEMNNFVLKLLANINF